MRPILSEPLRKDFIEKHFNFIKNSSYQGVNGIWKIDSGVPGPILGISIHTHGNEPCGLAALAYFREEFPLKQHLKRGTVIFVLNNILATEKFLNAKNDDEKRSARFTDINMNRLPNNTMEYCKNDSRYEVRRAQELQKIWEQFDIGFDIHSTSQENDGMVMNIGAVHPKLIRGFPITDIITNIENIQIGRPAVFFYGNKSTPIMGIEAGSHESPQAFTRAIVCADALLKNLCMIDGITERINCKYNEYFVDGALMFPDNSYSLVKPFATYEKFAANERIATNGKQDIFAPFTGHAIFSLPGTTVKNINEEVMFFLRPPKIITIE